MEKSQFLEEINKMDRDQIRKVLETNTNTKKKWICPVIFFRSFKKDKKEDES